MCTDPLNAPQQANARIPTILRAASIGQPIESKRFSGHGGQIRAVSASAYEMHWTGQIHENGCCSKRLRLARADAMRRDLARHGRQIADLSYFKKSPRQSRGDTSEPTLGRTSFVVHGRRLHGCARTESHPGHVIETADMTAQPENGVSRLRFLWDKPGRRKGRIPQVGQK